MFSYKSVLGEVGEIDRKKRTVIAYISTKDIDDGGDAVLPDAWDLSRYNLNSIVSYQHQLDKPAVGKALWLKKDDRGLLAKIQFAGTKFASELFELYAGGFMRAFSVGGKIRAVVLPAQKGFNELKTRWNIYGEPARIVTQALLYDVSCVLLPKNQNALAQAVEKSIISVDTAKKLNDVYKLPISHNRNINGLVPCERVTEESHALLQPDGEYKIVNRQKREQTFYLLGR